MVYKGSEPDHQNGHVGPTEDNTPLPAMNTALLLSKFWLGLGLIVLSFVIAQVTKVTFFLYITDPAYRSSSIVFYIFSWLMFFVGVWLVGREYYASIRKYTTLKFYHESVVEGTKKVAEKVRQKK